MTVPPSLPQTDAVARLFNDLLGRRVVVKPSAAKHPVMPATPGTFALFGASMEHVDALVFFDIALACYSGAALVLIPVTTVQPNVRSSAMPTGMLENVCEVMNIARSWFDVPDEPQAKLLKCVASPCVLPKDAIALLTKSTERLDLVVDITGYGAGKLLIAVR